MLRRIETPITNVQTMQSTKVVAIFNCELPSSIPLVASNETTKRERANAIDELWARSGNGWLKCI